MLILEYFKIRKIHFLIFLICISSLVLFYFYSPFVKEKNGLEISFFDVGQGDATLIKTPFSQNIVIDGGPDNSILRRLGENMPWYDRTIDLMILTHPHDDHLAGQIDILNRYKVEQIIYTAAENDSPAYDAWKEIIKKKNISTKIIDHPQKIILGQECELSILYPDENFSGKGMENFNNSSIVCKLEYRGFKALFVGDAESELEKKLLSKNIDLSADILKVAHHGSDTASSENFILKINPKAAIIQVGKNDFGLPSKRIINRLERNGAKIYTTDKGSIAVRSRGNGFDLKQ